MSNWLAGFIFGWGCCTLFFAVIAAWRPGLFCGGEAAGQGEEQARALDAACTPDSTGEADFRTDDDFGQGEEES